MNTTSRYIRNSALAGLCLAAVTGAYAQVSSINSTIINPGVFNDIPGATRASGNTPTSVLLVEAGVSKPANGGLNRDTWNFSNDGGASAYSFQNGDYFNASFGVTLTGSGTPGVDLEAGWLFSNPSGTFGGDLQSIVIGGNGAVVQFGGPSYYPFSPAAGGYPGAGGSVPNYALGETYTLGLNYVIDPVTLQNAFQYSVNGIFAASSPGNTYFDLAPGVDIGGAGNVLGGYLQIGNDPNNPANNGEAYFSEVKITSVPEPTTIALLGAGVVGLLMRRRRN